MPERAMMACDASFKTNVAPVDAASILASVQAIPIFTYSYAAAPSLSHIGPYSQSTGSSQGWNTTFPSRTPSNPCLIDVGDMVGTTLACIQALAAGGSSVWEWSGSVLTPKTGGDPAGTLAFPRTTVVTGAGTRTTFSASSGALRAGTVTGTQWDAVGAESAALGLDNAALGARTSVLGGSANTVDADSADSAILCGQSNTVGWDAGTTTGSTDCAVVAGVNNSVAGGACSWVGGGSSCSITRSQMSAACSGLASSITDSNCAAIVSGSGHSVSGCSHSMVGSGYGHGLGGTQYCAVLSGVSNAISGDPGQMSVVVGGTGNTMGSASWSVVCAGSGNGMSQVTGCFVGAGQGATVTGSTGAAVVGGQTIAVESSDYAFVGAGNSNSVLSSPSGLVCGGESNQVVGSAACFVVCGSGNAVTNGCTYSGVVTGTGNTVDSSSTTSVLCAEGTLLTACATVAALAANKCSASGSDHSVVSGTNVALESCSHAIATGNGLTVGGSNYTVALGAAATAIKDASNALVGPVVDCTLETAEGCCVLVGTTVAMSQSSYSAVVCASRVSVLAGTHCAVLCGSRHSVQDCDSSSILAGTENAVFGTSNAICGSGNTARTGYGFIAGQGHVVGEDPSKCTHVTVSGLGNKLAGATVHLVHGDSNALGFGDHSVFLGSNCQLDNIAARNVLVAGGAFSDGGLPAAVGGALADVSGTLYNAAYLGFGAKPQTRALSNCFTAIFNGVNDDGRAFELWTSDDGSAGPGLYVDSSGMGWVAASSRHIKEAVEPVDEEAVAASGRRVPLVTFRFKGADPAARCVGSIAQDWAAAFRGVLPGPDDPEQATGIGVTDVAFVALAVARDAQRRIDALAAEVRALRDAQR